MAEIPLRWLTRSTKKVTRSRRKTVLKYADWKCCKCGKQSLTDLTVDHVIPLMYGGTSEIFNLRAMCKDCNGGRIHYGKVFEDELLAFGVPPAVVKRVLERSSTHMHVIQAQAAEAKAQRRRLNRMALYGNSKLTKFARSFQTTVRAIKPRSAGSDVAEVAVDELNDLDWNQDDRVLPRRSDGEEAE